MMRLYAGTAAGLVALLLGVLLYLVFTGRGAERFAQCRETAVAGGTASLGGPLSLTDHTGRRVTEADLFVRPTLVYFGYTFCPDVCPLDMARNVEVLERLAGRGIAATLAFVSVDPGRDTPERLADFVAFLDHPDVIGLTGTPAEVQAAARAYRAYYRAHEATDAFYLVDHSTFSYLVLPRHGVVEVFRRDMSAEEIADRVACFVAAA